MGYKSREVRKKVAKVKYYLPDQRKTSRATMYIFFGILTFILVFFPFYGINLRYQVGFVFSKIFDTIGMISLMVGGVMTLISFLSVFTGRSVNTKYLIGGILLLWVGCWCTGAVLDLFGLSFGDSTSSGQGGYH